MTTADKATLLGLKAAGKTFTFIGEILNVDRRTVSRTFKRIMETKSYARRPGSGRKRKTSDKDDTRIIREVKKNRCISAKDIMKEIPELKVSEWTIRRRINEKSEFASYWQTKKPFISEVNRRRRVEWAKAHLNWSLSDWKKVLWSDESPFVLRFHKKQRVWRSHNERYYTTSGAQWPL